MKRLILILLMVVNVLFFEIVYAKNINKELSDNLLRLHILANSDSEFDQYIKLKVRDFVIEEINSNNLSSKNIVLKSIKEIEKSVNFYLDSLGIEYNANVSYRKNMFPHKNYNTITMPSGEYEAIQVVLGNGYGKNWWCVAYPPLCFTESVVGQISDYGLKKLDSTLSKEAYSIITKKENEYIIKFKVVDIFNSLMNTMRK